MQQNEHLRESMKLAEAVQDELGTVEPGPDRGVKQAGFVVLVTAFMPAVLVEIGFGTNRGDAAFMTNPRSQAKLAGADRRRGDGLPQRATGPASAAWPIGRAAAIR